ncbi:MAG: thiamine ABC transporter substrate-binding protein [Candidatus Cloacimonadaceae bacterium]
MSRNPFCRLISLLVLVFSLLLVFGSGCSKKDSGNAQTQTSDNTLTIVTLDEIRSSGFLKSIIPAFEAEHNCKIVLNTVSNGSELIELIRDDKELRKADLVLGLNNCFLLSEEDLEQFSPTSVLKNRPINQNFLWDSAQRVIPYGFGYLALLYNEQLIAQPPESFGELQDSRFQNQLAVSSPHQSGAGRAALLWSVAMFGNDGFRQFWQSIKKNVHSVSDSYRTTLNLLETGQCGMTIGFTTTPAWLKENKPDALPLRVSLLQEGSFLYLEGASIPSKARNKQLAGDFLSFLLTSESQKHVAFELGLFPVNESTPLPESFSTAPVTAHIANDRLTEENLSESIDNWLEFFGRLFSGTIY